MHRHGVMALLAMHHARALYTITSTVPRAANMPFVQQRRRQQQPLIDPACLAALGSTDTGCHGSSTDCDSCRVAAGISAGCSHDDVRNYCTATVPPPEQRWPTGWCPCADPALCRPLAIQPAKNRTEVIAYPRGINGQYGQSRSDWRQYDWSKVTAIGLYAHATVPHMQHNARHASARHAHEPCSRAVILECTLSLPVKALHHPAPAATTTSATLPAAATRSSTPMARRAAAGRAPRSQTSAASTPRFFARRRQPVAVSSSLRCPPHPPLAQSNPTQTHRKEESSPRRPQRSDNLAPNDRRMQTTPGCSSGTAASADATAGTRRTRRFPAPTPRTLQSHNSCRC